MNIRRLGVPVLFGVLAIAHTWPLATAPASLGRNDNADTVLNQWIIAWVAHRLPRDPLRLFDANIFHPERDTLAFSEPLIVPGAMAIPLREMGASPVLTYNVLLLLGFALTGMAGYRLALWFTRGDGAAAVLAGSLLAFNTYTLTRLPHIQAIHAYGLPLALLALDRLLTGARTRDAIWLAVWMAVLAYTSGYLAVFGAVAIATAVLARPEDWWGRRFLPVAGRLALAAVVAGAAVLPVAAAYKRVQEEHGFVRTPEETAMYSARPASYLASAGRIHMRLWSGPLFRPPIDSFFPGVAALGLAGAGLICGLRRRREGDDPSSGLSARDGLTGRRVRMMVAIGAAGVVLSFGMATPIYGWLYAVLPPMQGVRAPSRFGCLFVVAVAVLAGLGLAALRARLAGRRWTAAAAGALVVLVNAEALRAPMFFFPFDGIPRLYRLLDREPGPVVLIEIPFYAQPGAFLNIDYVLASTSHWRPLVNGYSGVLPDSFRRRADVLSRFPDDPSIAAMRQANVTHVMVHARRLGRPEQVLAALQDRPDFRLMSASDGLWLFRLLPPEEAARQEAAGREP